MAPEVESPPRPVCQVLRRDADSSDEVGDLLVEGNVLAAADHDNDDRNPEESPGFRFAEDCRHLQPCLGGVGEETPRPRSLAIWFRSVGSGEVDGKSSRQPTFAGQPPPRRAVHQREHLVEDVFGEDGLQGRLRRVGVFAAEQVDGAPPRNKVSDVGAGGDAEGMQRR